MPQNINFDKAKAAAESGKQIARASWVENVAATYSTKGGWKLGNTAKGFAPWSPLPSDISATDWYVLL